MINEPISGSEAFDPADPRSALSAFYRAFNQRDLTAMGDVWLTNDEPSMSNPVGGIARGWNAIRSVYERIFSGEAQVQVEFRDYSVHEIDSGFVAVGRERGTFVRSGESLNLAIRTTRIFRCESEGWRQLHHHGSIDDPVMLERYQSAIREGAETDRSTAIQAE